MEPWKPKLTNYINVHRASGRSKGNAPCKKHPKHRQSPGVCSICLNEKLSQLSSSSDSSSSSKSARSPSSSSSSSSYVSSLSSSDVSSSSSPMVSYACRVDFEGRKPIRVFKKSRSMAPVPRSRKWEGDENGKRVDGGDEGGFWSKLLPRRRSRKIMHSRTMLIERVTAAVH